MIDYYYNIERRLTMYSKATDNAYHYEDPYEGLIIEMCKSYVKDYFKALKHEDYNEAHSLERQFRKCKWLSYITDNPDAIVDNMVMEGEKLYGKESERQNDDGLSDVSKGC